MHADRRCAGAQPWLHPGRSRLFGRWQGPAVTGRPVVLGDGSTVLIRQVHSADAQVLADGFARLSARFRQLRFLMPKKALSPAELRYFTDLDHHDHEALGALDHADGRGVGIARYVRDADDPQAAEIAVTILDDWQGLGLGTELVAQLSERARSAGIRRFTALIAADNPAMAGLLRNVRAELVGHEPGALQYEITLGRRKSTARLACLALAMIRQPACRTRSRPTHLQRWAALHCSPPSDSQPESRAAGSVSLEISLKLLMADPGMSIYPMRGSANN
jgi:RimJ/RimL family protein N-acetyltransferase